MNERDVIYDELSRVLTDYENNNGDRRMIACLCPFENPALSPVQKNENRIKIQKVVLMR